MVSLRWQYARTGDGLWMMGAFSLVLIVMTYVISALGHFWLA